MSDVILRIRGIRDEDLTDLLAIVDDVARDYHLNVVEGEANV